jgi:hypothetical protein
MRASSVIARAAAAGSILGAGLVMATHPANAQVARGDRDDTGIEASATNAGASAPARSVTRRRGTVATCTAADGTVGRVGYERLPADLLTDEQKAQIADGGGIYWKTCGGQSQDKYSGTSNGGVFIPLRNRGGPVADPGDLAEEAMERTPLPDPTIGMAPAPHIPQLVNLETFLWIPAEQWKPFTASASAGPVTSTVTATPKRVIWDMGQGDTVVCDGPGHPYNPALSDEANPSTCRFTYRTSSAGQPDEKFTVTATMEWETTWTVSGAAGGGGLGTLRRSSSVSVKVAELQGLNVGDRR